MHGTTLDLKAYARRERVGQGGHGVVYRAVHRLAQVEVAVKVVPRGHGDVWLRHQGRLERGCRLLSRLRHPNVVSVLEAGPVPQGYGIVTEFVRGTTLQEQIGQRGPLPWPEAMRFMDGIAAGVAHAHERGIVHRDLKPANVVIDAATGLPRVIDFDLAKEEYDDSRLSNPGSLVGTLTYLAPEELCGGEDSGPARDVYALGLMLYHMLCGRNPFLLSNRRSVVLAIVKGVFPPLRDAAPELPAALAAEIERAMSRDPARRHRDAGALRAALVAALLADGPVEPAPPLRRWRASLVRAAASVLIGVPCLVASVLGLAKVVG